MAEVIEVVGGSATVEVTQGSSTTVGLTAPAGPQGIQGVQGIQGPPGTTDYTQLQNVPATFPPSTHIHLASDVTNFNSAAAAAAPVQSVAGRTGTVTLIKADVGLGDADNTSDLNKPISTATQTALDGKAATAHTHPSSAITDFSTAAAAAAPVQSVAGKTGSVALVKADVGLGNVDNTADTAKPVSTAQQTALNGKANISHTHAVADVTGLQTALDNKQASGNYATLDNNNKLTASQIPDIAITDYLGAAANQNAMLALVGQRGDWCSRTDLGTNWVMTGNDPANINSWTQLSYPASPVVSVNGKTGAVTLGAADVGALQSALSVEDYVFDSFTETLPARRNVMWYVNFVVSGQTRTLNFPTSGVQVGDRMRIALTVPASTTLIVRKPDPGAPVTIATVSEGTRFIYAAQVTQIISGTPLWISAGELSAAVGASPLTSTSTGTVGQFSFSSNFMYVCISDNTWRRVPIAAF